jgi:hypothetical protein
LDVAEIDDNDIVSCGGGGCDENDNYDVDGGGGCYYLRQFATLFVEIQILTLILSFKVGL